MQQESINNLVTLVKERYPDWITEDPDGTIHLGIPMTATESEQQNMLALTEESNLPAVNMSDLALILTHWGGFHYEKGSDKLEGFNVYIRHPQTM